MLFHLYNHPYDKAKSCRNGSGLAVSSQKATGTIGNSLVVSCVLRKVPNLVNIPNEVSQAMKTKDSYLLYEAPSSESGFGEIPQALNVCSFVYNDWPGKLRTTSAMAIYSDHEL